MKHLLLILLLVIPRFCLGLHPLVDQGNTFYKQQKYSKAFERYADYLFDFALVGSQKEYYIALIGLNLSMKHITSQEIFNHHVGKWSDVMLMSDFYSEEKKSLIGEILNESVFWVDHNNTSCPDDKVVGTVAPPV